MMKRYMRIWTALILVGLAGALYTCSGTGSIEPQQVREPAPQRNEATLGGVRAELDAMPCPEGVEQALWAELKEALEEALRSLPEPRLSSRDAGTRGAALPAGAATFQSRCGHEGTAVGKPRLLFLYGTLRQHAASGNSKSD